MALITDYSTLTTAITDYLARSDLSSFVPNFLQNCQGKIYRSLRLRAMETALSGTITGGVLAVPADYRELKYAYLTTSPSTFLERTTPELIYTKWRLRSAAGRPLEIAREAENFIFGPYPDGSSYALAGIYYALLPLLSAANPTNWFIENAPEVMLYGALLEAQPFLMNDKRMQTWQMLYDQALETVKLAERRENFSGSTLATKVG